MITYTILMIYILRWLNSGLSQETWKSLRHVFKKHSWWQALKSQWGEHGAWSLGRREEEADALTMSTQTWCQLSNMAAAGTNHSERGAWEKGEYGVEWG